MKRKNYINPNELKGNDQINKMRSLMGISQPISENTSNSVIELTKLGPDGKVYGIVRENQKYFIKITNKKQNLIAEDFMYIGGLQNKLEKSFDSYSQATKHLNLKFLSLNEALNKSNSINTLLSDNLNESFESYSEAPKPSQPDTLMGTVKTSGKNDGHDDEIIGDEGEEGNPDVDTPPVIEEDCEEDSIELTENEKKIDAIIRELRGGANILKKKS